MKEALLFGRVVALSAPKELRQAFDVVPMFIGRTREAGTFRSDVTKLRALAGPTWNDERFDLLTVMCALRAADRFVPSRDINAMSRHLHIAATVHDEGRWRELTPLLRHAVYQLSGDKLDFHPVLLRERIADAMPVAQSSPSSYESYRPDCVCLFSGGADSFCGAVHLLSEGRRPLLISVSIGGIAGRQRMLMSSICSRFQFVPDQALVQLTPWPYAPSREPLRKGQWQHRDKLQRLRAMFFLSLAALVARSYDLDELFMCENGIIGSAITFSPYYDNATITRPSEPHFLRAMQDFLRQASSAPALRIRNPFQYMTKGEVLRGCAAAGFEPMLPRTVSCWRSGNQGIRNCGVCAPCLFRQLAFDESGLRACGRYENGRIPKGMRWRKWNSSELQRLTIIRDYCARAITGGVGALMNEEPVVMDAIDVTGGPTATRAAAGGTQARLDELAPERMAATVLRFAGAVVQRLPSQDDSR